MDIFRIIIYLFICLLKVFCIDDVEINFFLDYFKYKNVTSICLLNCQDDRWKTKFAKTAIKDNFSIASVNVENEDLSKTIFCLRDQTTLGIIIFTKCKTFQKNMFWASDKLYFGQNFNWLIIHDEYKSCTEGGFEKNNSMDSTINFGDLENEDVNISTVINTLQQINISVDADIKFAKKTDEEQYEIYDIFNFGKIRGGQFNLVEMGIWTLNQGLQVRLLNDKYRQRWNFQNIKLKMAVVSARPKQFKPEMATSLVIASDVNVITKITTIVLNIIAETHNITYSYMAFDRWVGSYDKNSTRVAANSLYFREADVTMLRLNPEIRKWIDFVNPPLTSLQTKYYYRIPNFGVGKYENRFITPLSPGVWGCIIAVSMFCGFVLVVAAKLERRESWAQYAVFTVVAFICQQFFEANDDTEVKRVSSARKLTLLVTGISCLLLYNYYTSSVVSWLLNGPPPSINSLKELLESPLELIYEDIGYTKSWLQIPSYFYNIRNANIETELRKKKVFSKKKNDPLLMTLNEGIEMVKAGGYAFHAQEDNANTRISQTFDKMQLCELGSLQSMPKTDLYASISQRSPYREFFAWRLARLKETGLISCIQRRLAAPDISCDGSVPQALALGGAAPAFIMLAFGYFMSVVVLAVEVLRHRTTVNKRRFHQLENKTYL